ncbi:hypothetical protein AWC38_SpisGene19485 [Stylophora pistillata]|uniref:CCHC-type domain-containing protein n=1 Tax=Stylophora pistillata TaxID=50429 RepID=A0A2B4RHG7_STYPI|nr:hypothetical protein AWC38_SpisGene19485 [Stylophora pistillata]
MTPPAKMIYSVSPRMTNKSLGSKCLAGKDLNNNVKAGTAPADQEQSSTRNIAATAYPRKEEKRAKTYLRGQDQPGRKRDHKALQRHKEKGTCPQSLKYRARAKIRADEDFKKEIKQISNNAEQETVKAIMCFHEREIQKRKRAKTAGTLNNKNCSTIESARVAQAESSQDNVTIETVEKIAVNLQEQIAQFGTVKSDYGWTVIQEYKKNDLADDLDDEKIIRAEARARTKQISQRVKSRMTASRREFPKSQPVAAVSNTDLSSALRPIPTIDAQFRNQTRPGSCFACDKPGHWRAQCPLLAAKSRPEIFQEGLWKDTSFKDPDLQSLSSRLQTTILLARAPRTVNMYDRAFRKWKEFALRKQELSYFPANPMHVAVYLRHVLESTRSIASVDTAFYSIKWAHESAGLVSSTDNPLVNRVRDAAKRILGTNRGNRKEPLSIEILKDIIDGSDLSNTLQLRNVVETSVTTTDNIPSQDYTHPDDQTTPSHIPFE